MPSTTIGHCAVITCGKIAGDGGHPKVPRLYYEGGNGPKYCPECYPKRGTKAAPLSQAMADAYAEVAARESQSYAIASEEDAAAYVQPVDPHPPQEKPVQGKKAKPSKQALLDAIDHHRETALVAKHFGVSESSIYQWKKDYDIPTKLNPRKTKPKKPAVNPVPEVDELNVTRRVEINSEIDDVSLTVCHARNEDGEMQEHLELRIDGVPLVEKYPGVWDRVAEMVQRLRAEEL
jgi:hypothetical protein